MAEMSFIFGKGQKARTPEEARRLREFAEALMGSQRAPQNVSEGLMALANGLSARFAYNAASKASAEGRAGAESKAAPIFSALFGRNSPVPGVTPTTSKVAAALAGKNDGSGNLPSRFDFANAEKAGKGDGTAYASFMGEVKKGLTNPHGLAAVAATGKAESSWSPTNVAGTWNDPSQSGKAGTAGGAMSWRNERLAGLQDYARKNGLDPTDPTTQAKFFMQEDPTLVAGLQNARSVEEAQGLINNAWKFAGYDQPGGESARRLAYAKEYLPSFQGGSGSDTMVGSAGSDRMGGGFDWSPYAVEGATRPDSFSGMQPEFSGALEQMFAAAPPEIREQLRVGSGYRSTERQAELYQDALKKYGSADKARKWVAPPGNSQHNHGAAADLKYLSKEAREWVRANAGRFGLSFPLGNEPWHVELATARGGGSSGGAPLLAGRGGTDRMLGSAGSDTLVPRQASQDPRIPSNIAASRFDGPGSMGDPGVQAALAAQRGQQPQGQGAGPMQAISRAFGFGGQPQPQEAPQVAQAPASQEFPPQPPAPTAGDAGGGNGALSMENLYRVLQDPWVDEGTKRVVMSEIQRQQQAQDPMYQAELELRKAQAEKARRGAGDGDETFFGNPVAIKTKDGIKYGQVGNKGTFKEIDIGEGNSFAPNTRTVDTGTELLTVGPGGEILERVAKENRTEARDTAIGKAEGEAAGQAIVDYPGAIQKADDSIALIDAMIDHPGRETATGASSTWDPRNYFAGTEATDFNVRRKQLEGRAFLEAFESLKGAGQITEVEGQKATQAIARLDTAQSDEAYLQALTELRGILETGKARARAKAGLPAAGGTASPPPAAPPPTGGGNQTSTGIPWSIEP